MAQAMLNRQQPSTAMASSSSMVYPRTSYPAHQSPASAYSPRPYGSPNPGVGVGGPSTYPRPHPQQQAQPRGAVIEGGPYVPTQVELSGGERNRLLLSLKSGIPSEVDYALPKLVTASYYLQDTIRFEIFVDLAPTLLRWPLKWVDSLHHKATLQNIRDGNLSADDIQLENGATNGDASTNKIGIGRGKKRKIDMSIGFIPEWSIDPMLEKRATECLLILRNLVSPRVINPAQPRPSDRPGENANKICQSPSYYALMEGFFGLPEEYLLETTLLSPEPTHHLLNLLTFTLHILPFPRSTAPVGERGKTVAFIFTTALPKLLVQTRDKGLINVILPLLIPVLDRIQSPPPPPELISHLLNLVTYQVQTPTLELSLDLLIALTIQSPTNCRNLISTKEFPQYLKTLVGLLKFSSREYTISINSEEQKSSKKVLNPVVDSGYAEEEASRRRTLEREESQRLMSANEGQGVENETGDKAPVLGEYIKSKLFKMTEPGRSISWMHQTFVYSSTSQLLQVTFWHAYRDFFQHPDSREPMLSAAEVIRNVTVAFPGASAKAFSDERGQTRFVIAGMGFRKALDNVDRFICMWSGCQAPPTATNRAELLKHIQSTHLDPMPTTCNYGKCQHSPFTLSHLLTHLPTDYPTPTTHLGTPRQISLPPSTSESIFYTDNLTSLPTPILDQQHKLSWKGMTTPTDPQKRTPTGTSFLSALLIKILAKYLKAEIAANEPWSGAEYEEKKKHLKEERFGLPIPENVLKEEEEEEKAAGRASAGSREAAAGGIGLGDGERERAKRAFELVEGDIGEVADLNVDGLGRYLVDALGW